MSTEKNLNSTPPKAEGVGEWEKDFDGFCKEWAILTEKGHEEDHVRMVKNFIRDLLTSATRAAEERKDGEIRGIVEAARKLSEVLWDTMPFFTKEVGAADLELRKLLPPPPDNAAQP